MCKLKCGGNKLVKINISFLRCETSCLTRNIFDGRPVTLNQPVLSVCALLCPIIEKSDRKSLLASTKLFINYKKTVRNHLQRNIFRGVQAMVFSMKKLGKATFDYENTFRKIVYDILLPVTAWTLQKINQLRLRLLAHLRIR
jgi:hypothetical protein